MLNIFSCAHWPFVSQGNLSLSLPSPVGPLANPENFLPCSKCLLRGSYQKLACFLLCGCLWTPACASPVATTAQGGEARDHGRTMKDILPSSWAPPPSSRPRELTLQSSCPMPALLPTPTLLNLSSPVRNSALQNYCYILRHGNGVVIMFCFAFYWSVMHTLKENVCVQFF